MPLYTFRDRSTGKLSDRFMSIAERDVLVASGAVEQVIGTPMIMRPMPEYRSPIDGRVISSRAERRDDLERNNCREWDPADSPTRGKLRNERFARKVGGKVAEEHRDHPLNQEFRAKNGARAV